MNNRKLTSMFVLIAALVLVGISLTFAYFTSNTEFENEFHTGYYKVEAVEDFVSPEGWMPGDETNKTLVVTNKGNVPVKVRVSYTEKWETNETPATSLSLTKGGVRVAVINFDNTSDWTHTGDYYYYVGTLATNESTSSFIKSVTFNPVVDLSVTCETSADGKKQTCASATDDYGNATYILTINVETIQADAASEVWGI